MGTALFMFVALALDASKGDDKALNRPIAGYVKNRIAEFGKIPDERKKLLKQVANYVRDRDRAGPPARLMFICTHNSRRSQMGQVWAQTAAAYYGVPIETFSGGTEATAFNSRAVAALKRAGFEITVPDSGGNPRYQVRFRTSGEPLKCYSKVYKEAPNPTQDFCAVMTCSQADQNCPDVAGASLRVPVDYEDPKIADGTPEETARYDERCAQIAREMLFVFSRVER